jgi:hypothetical protein
MRCLRIEKGSSLFQFFHTSIGGCKRGSGATFADRVRSSRLSVRSGDDPFCVQRGIVPAAILEDLKIVIQEIAVGESTAVQIENALGKF